MQELAVVQRAIGGRFSWKFSTDGNGDDNAHFMKFGSKYFSDINAEKKLNPDSSLVNSCLALYSIWDLLWRLKCCQSPWGENDTYKYRTKALLKDLNQWIGTHMLTQLISIVNGLPHVRREAGAQISTGLDLIQLNTACFFFFFFFSLRYNIIKFILSYCLLFPPEFYHNVILIWTSHIIVSKFILFHPCFLFNGVGNCCKRKYKDLENNRLVEVKKSNKSKGIVTAFSHWYIEKW